MPILLRLQKNPLALLLLSISLVSASLVLKSFPILIFVAIAPLFALTGFTWNSRYALITLLTACVAITWLVVRLPTWSALSNVLVYACLLAVLWAVYTSLQNISQHKIKAFVLILWFLGMEFVLLRVAINKDPFFLADILQYKPTWTRWNYYTGYMGISFWILLTNLLFYYGLFRVQGTNIFYCVLGILLIVLPIVYSIDLTNNAITKADLIHLYSGVNTEISDPYTHHGELISRTGAWVSVLIIIFTLVKGIAKKVAR